MRIVFDCGEGGPPGEWGPWQCEMGLGGSEECVVYLARALAARGHDVQVFNRCGYPLRDAKVRYFLPDDPLPRGIDLLVAWRDWRRALARQGEIRSERHAGQARKIWLWCHDIPVEPHFPAGGEGLLALLGACDRVVLLNAYHRRLYAGVPQGQVFLCPIGIVPEQFEVPDPPERLPGRVVYASHPDRGLDRLRALWPQVRAQVPEATLAAFWWEPEHFRPAQEEIGILPMRSVGHADLAREMMRSQVLSYPCTFAPEISPAVCIKAQAAGAIPVYVPQGGMPDVIRYGYEATPETFARTLMAALLNPNLNLVRAQMIPWARQTYDWNRVARRWEEEMDA